MEPLPDFLRNCKDFNSVSEFKPEDADFQLFNFRINFDFLYENFGLNMTVKTHVI